MSTTVIDNLQSDGDTPPSYPYIRVVGALNENIGKVSVVTVNPDTGIHTSPSYSTSDAFNRTRVSSPISLFDSKQIYAKDTLFWTESLVTGATSTFLTNEAAVQLETTTTNGSSAIRQTRQYMIYQPGRGFLLYVTGVMGAIKANVRQRIGYFDTNNGIFFEQDGTNLRVVRRTFVSGSAVDNAVNQSSWNIDPLDGTGRSGYSINTATLQVFVIDFSWLGAGQARLGVLSDNFIFYCHEFAAANTLTAVWSQTPTLPVRFELTNTAGTASNTTMKQICAAALSEGGLDPQGLVVAASTGAPTAITATATETAIIGVRLSSTFNRASLFPISFDALTTSNTNVLIRIYGRATLTGGAWVATTGVATEYNITPTAFSATGAVILSSIYLSANTTRTGASIVPGRLVLVSDFAGNARDELIITAQTLGGNAGMHASLTWKEIY